MPFKDLENFNLKDFVLKERDHENLWLFMHIPKTAGSSFAEAMRKQVFPYRNIEVDYNDASASFPDKIGQAADAFIADLDHRIYKSASGHIYFDLVERIQRKAKKAKVVTLLRDPVSRVVSDYRYQRTVLHPLHLEFIEQFPALESYIAFKGSQNTMATFISGHNQSLDSDALISRLDNEFSFVGAQEMYPLSYNIIFNLFGIPDQFPTSHARKTPDIPATKVEITDDLMDAIRDANRLDVQIYNHIIDRLLSIKETWVSYVNTGFPDEWQN